MRKNHYDDVLMGVVAVVKILIAVEDHREHIKD